MANPIKKTDLVDFLSDRFLVFTIDDSCYGLPLALAIEILNMQSITRLPRVAEYVKGIINLRGKVIPVLDVRQKLGLPKQELTKDNCIIVIDIHDMLVGLIVDAVSDVVTVPEENIVPPPKTVGNKTGHISSIFELDGKVVLNLDCEAFFKDDFMAAAIS